MNDDNEKVSFSLNGIPLWLSKQIFDEKPSENYDSIFEKKILKFFNLQYLHALKAAFRYKYLMNTAMLSVLYT